MGAGQIETTRQINAGGLNRTATGSAAAFDTNIAAKISHIIPVAETLSLIPSVTGTASWQRQNGFTEKGAGSLNMKMDEITVKPVTIKPMLTMQKSYSTLEHGVNMTTSLGIGALWQVNERQTSVTAGFAQSNVPQFTVAGTRQRPLSGVLQAGFTLEPTQGSSLIPKASFTVNSQVNPDQSNHTGTVHLTWNW